MLLHSTQHRGQPEAAAAVAGRERAPRQELLVHAALGLAFREVELVGIQVLGHLSVPMLRTRGRRESVNH